MFEFRWIEWNLEKCESHGVDPEDAESIVNHADSPFPERIDDEKFLAWGQAESGRYLQVIYLAQEDGVLFVIHARPLTSHERRRYRRRRRP